MAPSTLWLSSTSPLPPIRGEDGQRVDMYMPAEGHGGTRNRRAVLFTVLTIVPLVLVVLYTMSGCGSAVELHRARESMMTRLAPVPGGFASGGERDAARFEAVAVAGVTESP